MRESAQRWANALGPEARQRLVKATRPILRRLPTRTPWWGNLRRRRPFSDYFGYDRGQPVDRVYIERFLRREARAITGDVLEVRSPDYTNRFGTGAVRSHVVDINPDNTAATIIGDLCESGTLPSAAFGCIILTQTLHFLREPSTALENMWRSLRPSGTLLITVPCMARIDFELPHSDFWRWTPVGLRAFVAETCPDATIRIDSGGNLITALAFLLGLAAEDLRASDFADDDAVYPVTACAAVTKPPEPAG